MTFQVNIHPSELQFSCEGDETVLASSIKTTISLPYGCKSGSCGLCKGKLLSGEVHHGSCQEKALSGHERERGFILLCRASPQSDLAIQIDEVNVGNHPLQIKKIPTRVVDICRIVDGVVVLTLQLPHKERLDYLPGQYVDFLIADGKRRSYSIGNIPCSSGNLSFHIRYVPGGLFTEKVFGTMKVRDILYIEGPLGSFFLRKGCSKPVVLLASGTGFSPIKAIVEQCIQEDHGRRIRLYWGVQSPESLYMAELCKQWESEIPYFSFVPVVSDVKAANEWQGRTGFVHQAVVDDLPDLSSYQVYACGAPIMVDTARDKFTTVCKLPPEEFYSDSFSAAID